jgi:hypothetical protein
MTKPSMATFANTFALSGPDVAQRFRCHLSLGKAQHVSTGVPQ